MEVSDLLWDDCFGVCGAMGVGGKAGLKDFSGVFEAVDGAGEGFEEFVGGGCWRW